MKNNKALGTVLSFDGDREFWNRMRYRVDRFYGGAAPLAKLLQRQYTYKYLAPETWNWMKKRMHKVYENK